MHDYFPDYIIRKFYLASGLCNLEIFFQMYSGLHNPKTSLWGDTKRIKMYFHVVYGGGRRRYGGVGRNSRVFLLYVQDPLFLKSEPIQLTQH